MDLAQKIKKIRKERKVSQHDLAEKVGINPNHLSRLETGKYNPSVSVLKKIAESLEVPVEYLMNDEDGDIPEIQVRNKSLLEKVKLIETLDEEDQEVITKIIDTMLTKAKMKAVLSESKI